MPANSAQSITINRQVDANALKTNQATIVAVASIAFVLGSDIGVWLIIALALALGIGAARPGSGPIQLLYRRVLVSLGIVKPSPQPSDPAPHRFAQGMGASVLLIAALLLLAGATAAGWVLAWLVLALALVNLLFGFCAGCFVFLQMRRAGLGV